MSLATRVLELRGVVGGPGFNVAQVRTFLSAADNQPVRIIIASWGGCSNTSAAVHTLIKSYSQTEILIDHAGSAAVAPALAGKRRIILAGGSIFMHRAWHVTVGTCQDLGAAAKRLEKLDLLDAQIYAKASKQPVDAILKMMDAAAVLDAPAALDQGFVHEIASEPGGESFDGEIWHRTARNVVDRAMFIHSDAGRAHEVVKARGEAAYEAGHLVEDYPADPAPPNGHPVLSENEGVSLRRRNVDLLGRLSRRLSAFAGGLAPDPRKSPITATWRCTHCRNVNYHSPDHDGRPTHCVNCMRNH